MFVRRYDGIHMVMDCKQPEILYLKSTFGRREHSLGSATLHALYIKPLTVNPVLA